jgi:hypothetical protein
MKYNETDLKFFLNNIWDNNFQKNNGGMGAPDLFTLYFVLNKIKPKIVVESGVWNGVSTKLIRKVLPDAIIICLDPREIPKYGYTDTNKNTIYYVGKNFIDFKNLNLQSYDPKDVLCFFDCHQNAYFRLLQCLEKKVSNVLFNDNYPKGCGSHYTIEQLMNDCQKNFSIKDLDKKKIQSLIELYHIFPNIYPGNIVTKNGTYKCESYFNDEQDDTTFKIFKDERSRYRWNTFIKLKTEV